MTADQCIECDGLTLGLSGDAKWCCYCGAKLTGLTKECVYTLPTEPAIVVKLNRVGIGFKAEMSDGNVVETTDGANWTHQQEK